MKVTNIAKELLTQAKFNELDNVYTMNIPKGHLGDVDSTDVLITELRNMPAEYGNNKFYSLDQAVQVQIFFKQDIEFDLDDFYIKLMRLFKKNNWQIEDAKNEVLDPDTNQLTKTFYFAKNKFIN